MAMIWFVLATLAFANGELEVLVSPPLVQPGVTPSFSVSCALLESEEARIVSMVLSRRTGAQGNLQFGTAEPLVSLSALTPGTPEVSADYPGLTVLGQITTLESELGSYIQVVWPSPTIEDLGIYTCEAIVIGEAGTLVTILGQAWVTTADPMIDRLLLAVQRLEGKLDIFNGTLLDLQERVDNITAGQDDLQGDVNVTVTLFEDENATTPLDVIPTQPPTGDPALLTPLDRLAVAIENVNVKLDEFNSTISNLGSKLDRLKEKTAPSNDTSEPVSPASTRVETFFTYNNSIYFLISTTGSFSTYSAQALCESRGLFLTEVQDANELTFISDSTAAVSGDSLLLIGGRRGPGTGVWRYPHSETEVTYFGDAILPEVVTKDADCLALQSGLSGLDFIDVVCSEDQPSALALCEDDLTEASGEVEPVV